MTIAKWSTISFFGLGALTVAGMVAAGCSVSTTDPGPTTSTSSSSGSSGSTDEDAATGDDAAVNACPANTKEASGLFDGACQAALNVNCCNELANCFDIVPTDSTKDDCNAYIQCRDKCTLKADGTPETDPTLIQMCQDNDCVALTDDGVVTAFDGLIQCINNSPAADSACPQ